MTIWNWFVSQDYWIIFVGVSLIPVASSLMLFWIGTRPFVVDLVRPPDIAMAYLGTVTLLFALFAAFMMGDIWRRESSVVEVITQEALSIQSILDLSDACGAPCGGIHGNAQRYAQLLVDHEWNVEWSEQSPLVHKELESMVPMLGTIDRDPAVSNAVRSGLYAAYQDLQHQRAERYSIINFDMAPHRWIMVTLLGVLTQISLMTLHAGRPNALGTVLCVFTLAFVAMLTYTASLAWPTADETVLPPALLERILRSG